MGFSGTHINHVLFGKYIILAWYYLMDWRHSHPTFRAAPPKPQTEKKRMECWEAYRMYSYAAVTSGLHREVLRWGWPVSMASASLKPDCTHNLRCFTRVLLISNADGAEFQNAGQKSTVLYNARLHKGRQKLPSVALWPENEARQSPSYYCL